MYVTIEQQLATNTPFFSFALVLIYSKGKKSIAWDVLTLRSTIMAEVETVGATVDGY